MKTGLYESLSLSLSLYESLQVHSLNFHSCRHMGHCCWTCCEFSHFKMQCMWKQWEHWPQTSGQSSPGTLQSGQQPLKGILQMPQFSSLATHSQEATPFHWRIFTFILPVLSSVRRLLQRSNTREDRMFLCSLEVMLWSVWCWSTSCS